ncbi:MAG: YeeE/YedE family protein [Burkholderiales bacterium]
MATTTNLAALVASGGFMLGFVFGFVANKTNFCTMGAVSDIVNMGSWDRMRMWLLAIAVAMLGAGLLQYAGLVDLTKSIYVRPSLNWLSYIVGGILFGVGMTLASGCGSKTLIRVGTGNLKSLIVMLVLSISAYMTLKGLFAPLRAYGLDQINVNLAANKISHQDLASVLGGLTNIGHDPLALILSAALFAALLFFILKDGAFRREKNYLLGGSVIGLLVVAGWYVSGHLGYGENPDTLETVYFGTNTRTIESLTFIAPVAYSLEILMLWTDKSLSVTFGIASTAGVILGSFAYALASRTFRWESFASAVDLRNHIAGGVLMGFGGVTAMGCTIGQGITGVSTLALGSFITFAGIVAGSAATIKYQYWRIASEN